MNGEFLKSCTTSRTLSSILQYCKPAVEYFAGKLEITYEFVISPNSILSIASDSCGALFFSSVRTSSLCTCVVPQSVIHQSLSKAYTNTIIYSPVWWITTIAPGWAMVCRTDIDLIASNARPPAFKIMEAPTIVRLLVTGGKCHD